MTYYASQRRILGLQGHFSFKLKVSRCKGTQAGVQKGGGRGLMLSVTTISSMLKKPWINISIWATAHLPLP